MLVGTASCGKTEIFKLLTEALTTLDETDGKMRWVIKKMNPKAISA